MSQSEALARIERARRRNAKGLNLSNLYLTEVPPEIGELTELRVFALLNDGLMKTFERFPGLDYKIKVPCCCSPNCPNEFELEDLESANSENMRT